LIHNRSPTPANHAVFLPPYRHLARVPRSPPAKRHQTCPKCRGEKCPEMRTRTCTSTKRTFNLRNLG
jgi:hypothetical protein